MPADHGSDSISALVSLVAELVREKDEAKRLIGAFAKGEISSEQIVNDLASRYQLEVAGTVSALAEHDPVAAEHLGQRLRLRLDSTLADIANRSMSAPRAAGGAVETPPNSGVTSLKEREDDVLLREHVLLTAICGRNEPARAADLIKAAKDFEANLSNEAVTAHLIRLVNADIVGKERKGRYHGTLQSRKHLEQLEREIEARGLRLPG